jgi:beta-phosphoglucomutase
LILKRLGILDLLDTVIDGDQVRLIKLDPEVFNKAAWALGIPSSRCVVFEDAEAGVEAAKRAGMGWSGYPEGSGCCHWWIAPFIGVDVSIL